MNLFLSINTLSDLIHLRKDVLYLYPCPSENCSFFGSTQFFYYDSDFFWFEGHLKYDYIHYLFFKSEFNLLIFELSQFEHTNYIIASQVTNFVTYNKLRNYFYRP